MYSAGVAWQKHEYSFTHDTMRDCVKTRCLMPNKPIIKSRRQHVLQISVSDYSVYWARAETCHGQVGLQPPRSREPTENTITSLYPNGSSSPVVRRFHSAVFRFRHKFVFLTRLDCESFDIIMSSPAATKRRMQNGPSNAQTIIIATSS